jgi:hypothetical protein
MEFGHKGTMRLEILGASWAMLTGGRREAALAGNAAIVNFLLPHTGAECRDGLGRDLLVPCLRKSLFHRHDGIPNSRRAQIFDVSPPRASTQ